MKSFALILTSVFAYVGIVAFSQLWNSESIGESNKKLYVPPPQHIQYLTFGFDEMMADSLWLRLVQDFDVCAQYKELTKAAEKIEPVDPTVLGPRNKNCDSSWVYLMLDSITSLAPRFRMPYATGAVTLSVLVEDYVGATAIFEKGLKQFPNDWSISYRAAYHYLFDLGQPVRAAELLVQSADNGGPSWLRSLASRLLTERGQLQLALPLLQQYLKDVKNKEQREKVIRRIEDIKSRLSQ